MPAPRRIAIFLPNWVGDVVMATPALRGLREHFAQAHVTYVGRQAALDTLSGGAGADQTLTDESHRAPRLLNFLRLAWRIRAGRFDLAVLFPNSFRTALAAWLAGVRRLAGYARDARGWMLTEKLPPPRDEGGCFAPVSAIDYYNALARRLGAACESRRMTLGVAPGDAAAADALLAEAGTGGEGPIVMLNPGSSFGPSKMWYPARFAELADLLIERRRARIIINAAPAEREIAADVAEAMRHGPAISFARRDNTLGLLKALLGRCDLLITNDTGARHLAAALGIGVVTLFGSTDPRWSRIDCELERIVRVEVPCSPCQSRMCLQPAGPLYHQCMEAITPRMVLSAAEELLDEGSVRT